MTHQEAFQASLQQELNRVRRNQSITNYVQHVFIGLIVLLPLVGAGLWYYAVDLELTGVLLWIALGMICILEIFLIPLLLLTYPQGYLLSRIPAELQIRLDIHQAVSEEQRDVFKDIIPGYEKVTSEVHFGAELLRAIEPESRRLHNFKEALRERRPDLHEAVALNTLIRILGEQQNVSASVAELEGVADELTHATVINLPTKK